MNCVGLALATLGAALLGCASTHSRVETSRERSASLVGEPPIHFHDGMDAGAGSSDAGASVLMHAEEERDGAGPLAVASEAGVVGGELAWLVAHIADSPDRLRGDDSDNVRQLAARGAAGVLAVTEVFRRADASRLAFARRVVERRVQHSCRLRTRGDAERLASWIELGTVTDDTPPDAGLTLWLRASDAAWPTDSIARVSQWVDLGMPCDPPSAAPAADAGGFAAYAPDVMHAARD